MNKTYDARAHMFTLDPRSIKLSAHAIQQLLLYTHTHTHTAPASRQLIDLYTCAGSARARYVGCICAQASIYAPAGMRIYSQSTRIIRRVHVLLRVVVVGPASTHARLRRRMR